MVTQPSVHRLSDQTLCEPLVARWPAWWLTVAPVPASMHLQNFQIPLLKAYLQTPEFHARAARTPEASGASFVGVPADRANDVRSLLQEAQKEQADRLHLAEAFDEFHAWLLAEARGQSMEPLYARIPEPLRGLVELVYDYSNRPSVRVIEGATYRSRYHKPQLQSLRLSRLETDARPFFLSTPRVPQDGQLDWPIEFSDERVDRLFALDLTPRPLGEIRELLGSAARSDEAVLPLLTDAPLSPAAPWQGPGVRVRNVGHATVLVECHGVAILTDPLVCPHPAQRGASRISFAELPERIDYALVTHSHADHFHLETLLRLRHRIGQLVVPRSHGLLLGDVSLEQMARALGFRHVVSLDTFTSLPIPDGEIIAAPFLGEHGDLAHGKSTYVIRSGREQLLFGADSACLDDALFRNLHRSVGEISTVFMNTETEGSPLTFSIEALFPKKRDRKLEKSRRCRGSNAAEGLRLLEILGAKRLYNYAMGLEPWLEHIVGPASTGDSARMKESDQLLAACRARGVQAERLNGPRDFYFAI